MTTTDINALRRQHKELRARFFPSQAPLRLVPNEPLAPPLPPKADAPVVKEIKIAPEQEPMDAEDFARKMRRGEFPRSEANYRRLIAKLAEEQGRTYEEIVGRGRKAVICAARFYIYWYLAERMKLPYARVGALLNKDHTSVMHGLAQYQEVLDAQKAIKREVKNEQVG